MSKYVKGLLQGEFEKCLRENSVKDFVVVSMMGISGTDNNTLRGQLKEKGVEVCVVKNSLFKKAMKQQGLGAGGDIFSGPCAIVYGGDSIVDVAKEVVEKGKKFKLLEIKGALLEGTILNGNGARELSKLPNRAQLQGGIVLLVKSPGAKVASAIGSPASAIAGCLKSIVENGEKGAA